MRASLLPSHPSRLCPGRREKAPVSCPQPLGCELGDDTIPELPSTASPCLIQAPWSSLILLILASEKTAFLWHLLEFAHSFFLTPQSLLFLLTHSYVYLVGFEGYSLYGQESPIQQDLVETEKHAISQQKLPWILLPTKSIFVHIL